MPSCTGNHEHVLRFPGYADGQTVLTRMQLNLQHAVSPEAHQRLPSAHACSLQAVGFLMCDVLGTHANLCYAVGVLSRHAAQPDNSHSAAVSHILALLSAYTEKSSLWARVSAGQLAAHRF